MKPTYSLKQAQLEHWILQKLNAQTLLDGDTTADIRRERVRAEIVKRQIAADVAGTHGGRTLTWSQVFEKTYGVPLADGTPTQLAI